jgi:hypothetical protein
MNIIKSYINLYQIYLVKIIQSENIDISYLLNLNKLCEKINNLSNKSKIFLLENITDKLYNKNLNIDKFFEINSLLVKKFLKNQEIFKNAEQKFNLEEFNDKLFIETPDKFITWLLLN